jgi:hypothetical protein
MQEPFPPNLFTRSLTVDRVEGPATLFRCSLCEWSYSFKNLSPRLDAIEQQFGLHGFCIHDCSQFRSDEIRSKAI